MTLASHTYFISSCAKISITRGYDAMVLLIITHYFTWKHLKWDIATVIYRKAMKMILQSGLKLKETRATAYQTPHLNDRWLGGCVELIVTVAFAVCGWYVL